MLSSCVIETVRRAAERPLSIPQAVSYPKPVEETRENYLARREKKQTKAILLVLGAVQLGIGGIVCVVVNLRHRLIEMSFLMGTALTWLIFSGLVALISSSCTVTACLKLSGNYDYNHSYDSRYMKIHKFSLFCMYIYESIVVIGSLLIFAATVQAIYVYSNSDSDTISLSANDLASWHGEIATFAFGLFLCFVQFGLVGIMQKTLVEPLIKKEKLHRERVAERDASNPEQSSLVLTTNPVADMPRLTAGGTDFRGQARFIAEQHDLPPRYSSVGLPHHSSRCGRAYRAAAGLPPQYSLDMDRTACDSPPPAFSTRRNTLQSLPPSYSETNMFLPSET